ncbi:hypothetical protein, partial [Sporolactobacillus inulinus]
TFHSPVKTITEKSDYVVLAWGMPKNFSLILYFEQAAAILNSLVNSTKKVFVFKVNSSTSSYLTEFQNPPHPSRFTITGLVRVDILYLYRIVSYNNK